MVPLLGNTGNCSRDQPRPVHPPLQCPCFVSREAPKRTVMIRYSFTVGVSRPPLTRPIVTSEKKKTDKIILQAGSLLSRKLRSSTQEDPSSEVGRET